MAWFIRTLAVLIVVSLLGVGGSLAWANHIAPPSVCLQIERRDVASKILIDARTGYRVRLAPPSASDKAGPVWLVSRSPDLRYGFYRDSRQTSSSANVYLVGLDAALDDFQASRRAWLDQTPLAAGNGWNAFAWAADSQHVLVSSNQPEDLDSLFLIGTDGSQKVLRGSSRYTIETSYWSGDSQFIAMHTKTSGGDGIDLWDVGSGQLTANITSTQYRAIRHFAWSPVGAKLAVVRSTNSGRAELLLLNAETGNFTPQAPIPLQINPSPTMRIKWSDSGEYLAIIYFSAENRWQLSLYKVGISGQIGQVSEVDLGSFWTSQSNFYWSKDSQQLLFFRKQAYNNLQVWSLLAATGELQMVADSIDQGLFVTSQNKINQQILLSSTFKEQTSLILYNLEAAPSDNSWVLLSDAARVLRLAWSGTGQHLAVSYTRLQNPELANYLAIATLSGRQVNHIPLPAPIKSWFWLRDNRHLVYTVESDSDEGEQTFVELFDAATNEVTRLASGLFKIERLYQDLSRGDIMLWWEDENGQKFVDGYTDAGQLRYRFSADPDQVGAGVSTVGYDPNNGTFSRFTAPSIFAQMQLDQTNLALPSEAEYVALPSWSASNGYMALPYASTQRIDSVQLYNEQGELLHTQHTPGQSWRSNISWTTCAPGQ
jgi:hypothetical protein